MNTDEQYQVPSEPGLFDSDRETFQEIYQSEIKKTRNKLLSIAIIVLLFSIIGLAVLKMLVLETFLAALVIPAILTALAFLALKEPLGAVISGILVMLGVWGYEVYMAGGQALLTGWLGKAAIIYLLLAGLQNAIEANRAKKQLKML